MNTSELKFWLDWYQTLDTALDRASGSIVAYVDPSGEVHHAIEERLLPVLGEIRELFRVAGQTEVFVPRPSDGMQVWPANWSSNERAAPLLQLVQEPAYLAQDNGFRVQQPDAPLGLVRLIELLEAQEFCRVVSERAHERCPAWSRIVPELFNDGLEKIVAEALPCFDLLRASSVNRVLEELQLPIEIMSPFLPYLDQNLSLHRVVRRESLVDEDQWEEKDADPS